MNTIAVTGVVVIWRDMLGGVLIGKKSLSWSGPLLAHQEPGERRETAQTSQCCLPTRNISWPICCIIVAVNIIAFDYGTVLGHAENLRRD